MTFPGCRTRTGASCASHVGQWATVGQNSGDRQEVDVRQGNLWGPRLAFYYERELLLFAEVWACKCSPNVPLQVVVNVSAMR